MAASQIVPIFTRRHLHLRETLETSHPSCSPTSCTLFPQRTFAHPDPEVCYLLPSLSPSPPSLSRPICPVFLIPFLHPYPTLPKGPQAAFSLQLPREGMFSFSYLLRQSLSTPSLLPSPAPQAPPSRALRPGSSQAPFPLCWGMGAWTLPG